MTELIKKLIKTQSVSGREEKLAKLIEKELTGFVDEIYRDPLGNLIALRKGKGADGKALSGTKTPKKLMLAAHMDEIGFIVTFIEENGYLRIAPIGGINFAAAAYTKVIFENGVSGVLVPEAQTASSDFGADKFCVDIGTATRKESEKRVSIGDYAAIEPSFAKISGTRYSGRPMDDKIGCAALIRVCRETASEICPNDTYFVFTVQEEVGCRGARTAAYGIMPDFAVVYDVTSTGDEQNARRMEVKLGGGAAIKLKDQSVICDPRFAKLMQKTAKENKIRYQLEVLERGGTDTSVIQASGAGAVAGALSIPTRYVHTPSEMFDMRDLDACVELTKQLMALNLAEAYPQTDE